MGRLRNPSNQGRGPRPSSRWLDALVRRRQPLVAGSAILVAGIVLFGLTRGTDGPPSGGQTAVATPGPSPTRTIDAFTPQTTLHATPQVTPSPSPKASPAPSITLAPSAAPTPVNVYAATAAGMIDPALAGIPPRVYVPNERSGNVVVIDPLTFKIVDRFAVGLQPEHIAPDWDLRHLYVDNMGSNSLTIIDPVTGRPVDTRPLPAPYNLYFTLDGTKAIDVIDYRTSRGQIAKLNRLDFYDRKTWKLVGSVGIPFAGADHLDMTADGRFLLLSTEYAGVLVKVDTVKMAIAGTLYVGGLPVDVRLSPDGKIFYVTNQGRNGVSLVDPVAMREIGFLKTGTGAHGLAVSRDATHLYVSNRLAGTISVIDLATRKISATWKVGRSPDMLSVSADGTQLWTSNRYHGSVTVVDTRTGKVLAVIATGGAPHGLVYYPQPGRLSLGHNGVFR